MDVNINPENIQNGSHEAVRTGSPATGPLPELHEVPVQQAPSQPYHGTATASAGRMTGNRRPGLIGLMLTAMLLLGMLLGGAGAGALMLVAGHTGATPTAAQDTSGSASTQLVAQVSSASINSIYKAVSPSIVRITSVVQSAGGGFGSSSSGQAIGSGLVIDSQGDILTNNHVINGASSLKVEFSDGSTYTAHVVGTAPQDDLAIVKSDAPSSALVPAKLGDSSTVQVGDAVIAIGYPYGLDQSVTSGIVSGLNRDGSGSAGSRTLTGLIQVDAAINPGNSGGPLLNAQGEVIGIDTMIESPVEGFTGVGLAIPINHAKSLVQQLEQGGQVQRPWLGISGVEIDQSVQAQYNLPVSQGILVMSTSAGGPAAQAGLKGSTVDSSGNVTGQIGDIITAIDGQKVASISDLTDYLNTKHVGDQVTLSIMRDGQPQSLKLTLQAWAGSGSAAATGN